jgi:hypothetical protein
MTSRRHSTRAEADRPGNRSSVQGKEPQLILFLRAIIGQLTPGQSVAERFTQQELRRLADEFELQNSDWMNLFKIVLSKKAGGRK